jgi:glyoxylase-like metal-dependent hydrolase (beta-lactamase superfamily II)
VVVHLGDHGLLIAGDCLYTLRHLGNSDVQAFGAGKRVEQYNAAIRRLNELRARLPELIVFPAPDHTAYQSEHLGPGLAKGHLTVAERARIRAYERSVVTPDGRLRTDRVPRCVGSGGPDHVGGVSE